MRERPRRPWMRLLGALLIIALTLAAGTDASAPSQKKGDERTSVPRAMAGKETGRGGATEPERSGTLVTVAIVGGIAAAVLVAVLLLKKRKDAPASTTSTTSVPATTTTSSTTTTTVPPGLGSIQIDSFPVGARIRLDGTDTGLTTPALLTGVAAGPRIVSLTLERFQDWQTTVTVVKDQTVTVSATFEAGSFRESFEAGTAAYWRPAAGQWTVANGLYSSSAVPPVQFAATEYILGDYGDYTMEVRCQVLRPTGGSGRMMGIVFRGASSLGKFYIFQVTPGGASPLWDVFEISNFQITRQYDPWQPTSLVHEGWNAIKIVASGNTFAFFANGALLGSRTILEAPARGRVGLGYEVDVNGSDVEFDDVVLGAAVPPDLFFALFRRFSLTSRAPTL